MMVDKKGGKKGKGKNHKKKKQNEDENVGEEEEANSGTRKGVGCMAKVNRSICIGCGDWARLLFC